MKSTSDSRKDLLLLRCHNQKDWADWLEDNHVGPSGIWLVIAKKGSGRESVTYAEALDVALCYGWIDGQKRSCDEESWLQKFTPRTARSIWSKVNVAKAGQLIESGRMKPAGMKAIENARRNGQWDAAYDSSTTATVPDDFQAKLDEHPNAKAFFATLDRTNRYAILFRIQTAKKAETRARRIEQFISMLDKHEKLHS